MMDDSFQDTTSARLTTLFRLMALTGHHSAGWRMCSPDEFRRSAGLAAIAAAERGLVAAFGLYPVRVTGDHSLMACSLGEYELSPPRQSIFHDQLEDLLEALAQLPSIHHCAPQICAFDAAGYFWPVPRPAWSEGTAHRIQQKPAPDALACLPNRETNT